MKWVRYLFCVRHIFTRIVKPQFEVGWGKNTSATRPSQFSLRSQFLKENVLNRHGPGRVKQNKALNKAGVSCFREQCVVAVVPTMSIAIVGVTSPSPQTAALTVASVHLAGLQQTHLSHNRPHPLFGKKTLFHSGGSSNSILYLLLWVLLWERRRRGTPPPGGSFS